MNRHDLDWDEMGVVWRATTLDKDVLAFQLGKRLRRQAFFRRLEIFCEILFSIMAVFAGIFLWESMEDRGLWRQVVMVVSLFALVVGAWATSLWMRRGTGGEAQSLTAMIDLAIARAESRRRRVKGVALGGAMAFFWGLAYWFLAAASDDPRSMRGLAFVVAWCSVWAVGLTGWEYVKWQREQKYLAQFRAMKEMLREEP
jgi:hypothetical protein